MKLFGNLPARLLHLNQICHICIKLKKKKNNNTDKDISLELPTAVYKIDDLI